MYCSCKVNIQDFLQVFQGSGIGKMEDNLTSADPLSYTTNGSQVDLEHRVSVSNVRTPTPQLPVELRIINIHRQTGKQFILKLSSEDNRRRGVTITFLPSFLPIKQRGGGEEGEKFSTSYSSPHPGGLISPPMLESV